MQGAKLSVTIMATALASQISVSANAEEQNYEVEFAVPPSNQTQADPMVSARSFSVTTEPGANGQSRITNIAPAQTTVQGRIAPAPAKAQAPAAGPAAGPTAGPAAAPIAAPVAAPAPVARSAGPAAAPTVSNASIPQGAVVVDEPLNAPNAREDAQRAYIDDQLYPATNDSNGTDAFIDDQGNTIPSQTANPSQPSFVITPNNQQNPASNEQIQEVSVKLLTTFDNAVLDGFRSLENSITLGLGQSKNLTIDNVAPALRGFNTDADGNLILRFSVPMAKSIVKKMGATAWNGLSNPILVWMVGLDESNDSSQLSLVSGQNLSAFAAAILQAAPDYKYRLMFPILDLEDIQQVQVNTVLNKNTQALVDATRRYGADYFISAAITNQPSENGLTLKWDLYTKDGQQIAQSSLNGLMDEVASLGAGDIARALMTFQKQNPELNRTPSELKSNNVDIDMLGPGEGFIRIKFANIRSLQDISAIKQAFREYGFDGDTRVIGFHDGYTILELVTNSKATNIEGSMRYGGDFTYLSPWTFSLKENATVRSAKVATIGKASYDRPNSKITNQPAARPNETLPRDSRDVGQGAGLPNRNTPAVQGTSY